ncbi:hypothetical protein EJB05_03926, partial [Eragrostis curvula]
MLRVYKIPPHQLFLGHQLTIKSSKQSNKSSYDDRELVAPLLALLFLEAPTAFSFHECTNLRVEDLLIVNSQKVHVSVANCTNVQLASLSITAPGKSPNTDGIQITRSKDVKVANCKIQT